MGAATDFDQSAAAVGRQFEVVFNSPFPFVIVVGLAIFAIWKVLEWRYGAKIERLEGDKAWLREQIDRLREAENPPVPPPVADQPAPLPLMAVPVLHVPDPAEREFIEPDLSLQQLAEYRMQPRTIQTDRYLASFKGKWARFEKTVQSTALYNDEVIVRLGQPSAKGVREEMVGSISAWFREFTPRLEALKPGDTVAAIGKIDEIGLFGVILTECEFVD